MPILINPDFAAVRDWHPPGWHWERLPSGAGTLVRDPGRIIDPDLLWWHWPRNVFRAPDPEEVVRRRIREEDEHVHRYMYLLDTNVYNRRWTYLQNPYDARDSHMVPALWKQSVRGSAPRGLGTGHS